MSDNTTLSAAVGSGIVLATDDISSVHYQRVKLSWGVDGSAVDASASNPIPVTLSSSGGLTSLALLDDVIGTVGATAPTKVSSVGGVDGSGNSRTLLMDCSGRAAVNVISAPSLTIGAALPAGANNIGDVDLASAIPAGDFLMGRVKISDGTEVASVDSNNRLEVSAVMNGTNYIYPLATAVTGLSLSRVVAGSSTNATSVKASAGNVYGYEIANAVGSIRYVKFHNTAIAPTAGTGIVYTVLVPASSVVRFYFNNGLYFSSGIGFTTVTGFADSDTAAVTANDLIVQVLYT